MNVFQSLRRNIREFYDQYPYLGCATWLAAAVAGFIVLLFLPPEVVEVLGFLFQLISLCGALFGSG